MAAPPHTAPTTAGSSLSKRAAMTPTPPPRDSRAARFPEWQAADRPIFPAAADPVRPALRPSRRPLPTGCESLCSARPDTPPRTVLPAPPEMDRAPAARGRPSVFPVAPPHNAGETQPPASAAAGRGVGPSAAAPVARDPCSSAPATPPAALARSCAKSADPQSASRPTSSAPPRATRAPFLAPF